MRRLRFALLLNGHFLERWQLLCLDLLEKSSDLVGVILAANHPGYTTTVTCSPLMRRYASFVSRKEIMDATERLAHLPIIDASDQTAAGTDFILKLGRGPIPKDISAAPRHGIWCFEHEIREDALPFFREVYAGEAVTHAALLAFTDRQGKALVLKEGWFRTDERSYAKSRYQVLSALAGWPERVSRYLAREGSNFSMPVPVAEPYGAGSSSQPTVLRFWGRIVMRHLRVIWERLFRHWQWNIGVIRVPARELLRSGGYFDAQIEWYPLQGRKRFLADPFGVFRDGAVQIFCEEFEYRAVKGRICTLAFSSDGFAKPQPTIELPVHMSYPFLIEDAGEIYCVPETCQANEVALFRAVEFPLRWSKVGVLLPSFQGVDPTIFRHAGRWWLMCTQMGPQVDTDLWIWYASDLRGPWTPHARNPVKSDVRSARPGGAPFVHDGMLYRPAQDCSKSYGWQTIIQRVTSLTPTEFAEEAVTVLKPSPDSPFPLGRHTLTPVGDIVLVDGHRAVFVWDGLIAF